LDVFDRRVLEVLLSAAATAELDSVALQKINQVSLWSASHGFDPSPMVAGLFRRAAESARSEATVVDSAFQDQVTECLRRAMGNNDDYRVVPELDLAHLGCPGVIVDLAVVHREVANGLASYQQQLVLIIEADGPSHYVRTIGEESGTSHTLCGKALMRRNSLRRLGYPVEEISFTHWKRLDRNSRQEYVESIVKARLLPQEKFLQSMQQQKFLPVASSPSSMLLSLVPSASSSRNALLSAMRLLSTAVARQPNYRPSMAADLPRGYEYTIQKKLVKSLRRGGDESLLSARGFCRHLTEILPERPPNIRLVRELLGELAHSPEFVKANRDAVDGLCAVLRGRIDEDSLSRIQGRALGEIAQSIGRLELPWTAEVTLIARHCQDRLGLESMPAAAVANVAYGVAKCGGADAGFVEALASDWLRRIRTASEPIQPVSHTVAMRSLSYMFDGQPCVVGLLQEFTRRVDISAFNDHQKSQIVGAQTRILRGPNTPQAGADIGHADATKLGLVDLATLVTAHARRQKALPEAVITRIISLLEDQDQDFDRQLLANLSRAVGSLLGSHSTASRGLDHLLEVLNNTVVKCPQPLPLPVLGSILWASLASPSPKVKRLASVLLTRVDRDALSTARPQ
ncbi:hypothetical protein FOZ63_003816, partial [Perkinsus olseni]